MFEYAASSKVVSGTRHTASLTSLAIIICEYLLYLSVVLGKSRSIV
eukprot:Gb_30964 [translate_table: standard]